MNFDGLINKAKTIASATGKKATEIVEVSKMKLQVVQINNDIDKLYKKIGELTYGKIKNNINSDEQINGISNQIDELFEQISELNAKISEAEQTVKCTNCGALNSKDSIFCSRCGKSLIVSDCNCDNNSQKESYVKIVIKDDTNN